MKTTSEKALEKAIKAHNGYYSYPNWEYNGVGSKIKVKDPIYGIWEPTYGNHVYGKKGHPDAANNKKYSVETFIKKAVETHGDRYDYSESEYLGNKIKIKIICKEHGPFWQTPIKHITGANCPDCVGGVAYDKDKFIELANGKHNNFYDYSEVTYVNSQTKVLIGCPDHEPFWQMPHDHLQGKGCPKCSHHISKPESEIKNIIEQMGYKTETNKRKYIAPKELDIYIPELNKAIEFNGEYWHYHPTHFKPGKHAMKSNLCRQKGIKLLHIREDLWKKDKEKMKEVILKFIKN